MSASILLGTGRVTWARHERITDRYGSICLYHEGGDRDGGFCSLKLMDSSYIEGQQGRLEAVAKKVYKSSHLGDWALGLKPTQPEQVGKRYCLGGGTLFFEYDTHICNDGKPVCCVGVRPTPFRPDFWLDVKVLYALVDQEVDLYFVPAANPQE